MTPRLSLSGSAVTAIVQNYYAERQKYWGEIFNALYDQREWARRLIVWDNLGVDPSIIDQERLAFHVHVIRSEQNTMLGRYAAAFLADTPYIFSQDNDLVIGPDTIRRLLAVAEKNPAKIVGFAGCVLADSDKPYSQARWVAEGPADVILGRGWLCHRQALAPGFTRILTEGIYPGRAEDIFFSMAAGGGIVVPCEYRNLDEEGVGLSHESEHFQQRDEMALFMRGAR